MSLLELMLDPRSSVRLIGGLVGLSVMVIVIRVKDWHDYRLLQPRPRIQAHVRRSSTTDVVLHVCGTMVDVPMNVLVSVNFDA